MTENMFLKGCACPDDNKRLTYSHEIWQVGLSCNCLKSLTSTSDKMADSLTMMARMV